MEVSVKAKERFCKDCNIPLRLFQEPYFMDRLKLYDKFYGTLEKWNIFVEELKKYHCEQDYFEEYNRVKDEAINCIKNSEAYQMFNNEDMNQYKIKNDLPNKDIFKAENDNRLFISIDMKKANFSVLQYYGDSISKSMFAGASTWEDFIGLFTTNKHIINSKYIRQVILGNCNPGRHITYEKYLMHEILQDVMRITDNKFEVVFFSNDEIVIDVTGEYETVDELYELFNLEVRLEVYATAVTKVPLKIEIFSLHKIHGTDGYYKMISNRSGESIIDFKCLDNFMLPFVLRKFLKEEVTENDKVFYHEGLLAKYIEVPNISITGGEV